MKDWFKLLVYRQTPRLQGAFREGLFGLEFHLTNLPTKTPTNFVEELGFTKQNWRSQQEIQGKSLRKLFLLVFQV